MTPNAELFTELIKFTGALSIVTGLMSWMRKGSPAEDAMVAEAAETVIDSLSDADTVAKIDCLTSKNLREQVTVEDALDMAREAELRRMERRN